MTALLLLLAALLIGGGWLAIKFVRAPYMDFDQHAATALAALTPDDPLLDETPLADAIEAYVALHAPKEH